MTELDLALADLVAWTWVSLAFSISLVAAFFALYYGIKEFILCDG